RPGAQPTIVGPRPPAADAQAPARSDVSVIRGAPRDRALRRLVAQNLRPPLLPFLAKPARDGLDDAVASDGRNEESAVEEDRVGADRGGEGGGGRGGGGFIPASRLPNLHFPIPCSPLPPPNQGCSQS